MLRKVLTVCLLAWMASAAMAGPLDEGMTASQRGDYATTLKLWRPLAEQGNVVAQTGVGFLYYWGKGVPQNYAEAVK
jgi:uncharacterized protein